MMNVVTILHDYQLLLSIVGGGFVWAANEWSKRHWQDLQRREEHYKALLDSVVGFHDSTKQDSKELFLAQLRVSWLHCPDEVLRRANHFLSTVTANSTSTAEEKETALRQLVLAMRKDLLPWYKYTNLRYSEYQILGVKEKQGGA